MWDRRWIEALRTNGTAGKMGRRLLLLLFTYSSLKYVLSRRSRPQLVDTSTAETSVERVQGKAEKTLLSQASLQILLAFVAGWFDVVCFKQYKCYSNMMTGNTVNLCYKVGGLESTDVSFLAAAIVHFCSGFTVFKCVDMKLKNRGSCTAVAPVIFAFFALADVLRAKYPQSRWHMLLLAAACGMVNSISAEKGKIVTNMMTGHFQSLSSIMADHLSKGLSAQQRTSAADSVRMVATFCSGICLGMVAWNSNHPLVKLLGSKLHERRFATFGAIYAAILVLHELPAPKRRAQPSPE
jgi:uncharacterized membrane protein YoaK (UPF0700 family)